MYVGQMLYTEDNKTCYALFDKEKGFMVGTYTSEEAIPQEIKEKISYWMFSAEVSERFFQSIIDW
jgi:hypothetical protein